MGERVRDVIVIGAGPAGSALARRLASRARVCVLERAPAAVHAGASALAQAFVPAYADARAPEREATRDDDVDAQTHRSPWRIGESLPGAAAVLLRRLGLFERFLADGHAERGASISIWDTDTPVWFDPLRDPNGPGWHLDRLRFDAMLRVGAEEGGATFAPLDGAWRVAHEGDTWRVDDVAGGQTYRAPVLVDATGRSAALCRALDVPRERGDRLVGLSLRLPPDPADLDRCTRTCADADGWWYSVRLPSGERVLALHMDADDPALRGLRDAGSLLAQARRQPLLADVLPSMDACAAIDFAVDVHPAGSAALDFDACLRHPGLFAVGDAALAFDPLSSQGLFHALASAESAAAAIARHLDGDVDAMRTYFAEMAQVRDRYRTHLAATYAGAVRHAERRFWARRRVAAPQHLAVSPAAVVR